MRSINGVSSWGRCSPSASFRSSATRRNPRSRMTARPMRSSAAIGNSRGLPPMPETLRLTAPLSGVIYPLERVPDPVFAQKLVGDGISIDPTDASLRAPCAGEVLHLHAAGHAVTLRAAGGVEVLMHIGIDTVNLKGAGFTPHVKAGDRVE